MEPTGQRRSRAQWQALIEQFTASGLSQAQFCEQQGLMEKSFHNRRLQLDREARASSFVPVTTQVTDNTVTGGESIMVRSGDVTIHCPPAVGMTAIGELVRALRDVE